MFLEVLMEGLAVEASVSGALASDTAAPVPLGAARRVRRIGGVTLSTMGRVPA